MYNWYLKFFKKEGFLSNVSIHLNPISNIIINPTPWKPAWIFSLVVLDWEDSISFGGSTKTLLSSYKQTNETCIISNHSSPWCLTKFWNWADDTRCHYDAWMQCSGKLFLIMMIYIMYVFVLIALCLYFNELSKLGVFKSNQLT